jgi:hypothetical protein
MTHRIMNVCRAIVASHVAGMVSAIAASARFSNDGCTLVTSRRRHRPFA